MKTQSKDAEQVQNLLVLLRQAHNRGDLNDDTFHKGVLNIAHQWHELGDLEEACQVISLLPPSYVYYVLPEQMAGDVQFEERMYELTEWLEANGAGDALEIEEEIQLTSTTPAKA